MKRTLFLTLIILISVTPISSGEAVIQTGDRLEISVWGHADLQQTITVNSEGYIFFPLIGKVVLAGKDIAAVGAEMEKRLAEYIIDPRVIINIIVEKQLTAGIYGGVQSQGLLSLAEPVSLQEAISQAGGLTPDADLTRVVISTPEKEITLNLLEAPALRKEFKIADRYSIYIGRKVQNFTVIGEIDRPGSYQYRAGLRLVEAIATAGFASDRADLSQIIINRTWPRKEQLILELKEENLEDLTAGKDNNPVIYAGDIIYIPEKDSPDLEHLLSLVPFLNDLKQLLFR